MIVFTLPSPLGITCIAIVNFPGCDVMNFEISFIFIIERFSYMTSKLRQKFKYLENDKSFQNEIKNIFHHFKGLSVATKSLIECAFNEERYHAVLTLQ